MTHVNLPALSVGSVQIHQYNGLYSLNDLHKASGSDDKHKPSNFIRLDTTQALIAEISNCSDLSNYQPVESRTGKFGGTYACRELVIAYAAWISAAFNLKVIRVFLDSAAPPLPQADKMSANRPAPAIRPQTYPYHRAALLPTPSELDTRIDDAAYLVSGIQHQITRTLLKDLMHEVATGRGAWRSKRWLLHLVGDDTGMLNIPKLTPIAPNHPLAHAPL